MKATKIRGRRDIDFIKNRLEGIESFKNKGDEFIYDEGLYVGNYSGAYLHFLDNKVRRDKYLR